MEASCIGRHQSLSSQSIELNKSNRNQVVDIARVAFYSVIILAHSKHLMQPSETSFILKSSTAYLGVEFFFIVSGYLMAKKAFSDDSCFTIGKKTNYFIKNKFVAILPYYILASVVCFSLDNFGKSIKEIANQLLLSLVSFFQLDIYGLNGNLITEKGWMGSQVLHVTWFLGAMFASLLLLYPLLLKNKDLFCRVIAPIISLFVYGWVAKQYGSLAHIYDWTGIVYVGLLRGIAGISLGCICYILSIEIIEKNLSFKWRIVLTIIEPILYVFVFLSICFRHGSNYDFVTVAFIAACVILTFSETSFLTCKVNKFLNNINIVKQGMIGKFAMAIFFIDVPARKFTALLLPDSLYNKRIVLDIVLVIILSIALIGIVETYRYIKKKIIMR